MNICQRIVGAVGRRVDEASPICDARLADGSRVNVIVPPLAIDGPCLTIRKFKKDKLTLPKLVDFGSINPEGAKLLQVIGGSRLNTLVSGGTGSGKTTLLNCLTGFIDLTERTITCEDSAELQLQQPHVVRLETRPPNLEGIGEVTMRDLVRNCLRMRPERIIVGEVRGPEAFDLLQAMNTGHDGSMGTVHANNPREAITRIENMVAMGGFNLPAKTVREQIASALNVIVQAARLRDGSRKTVPGDELVPGDIVLLEAGERVPADIRREGGVARMASIEIIDEIMDKVSIPVMAKVRIGHFAEARNRRAIPRLKTLQNCRSTRRRPHDRSESTDRSCKLASRRGRLPKGVPRWCSRYPYRDRGY